MCTKGFLATTNKTDVQLHLICNTIWVLAILRAMSREMYHLLRRSATSSPTFGSLSVLVETLILVLNKRWTQPSSFSHWRYQTYWSLVFSCLKPCCSNENIYLILSIVLKYLLEVLGCYHVCLDVGMNICSSWSCSRHLPLFFVIIMIITGCTFWY